MKAKGNGMTGVQAMRFRMPGTPIIIRTCLPAGGEVR